MMVDLNRLEQKLSAAKKKFSSKKLRSPADCGVAFNFLSDLIAGILVGSFVGYQCDIYFNTLPLFLFIFSIFGIAVGFYIFYKDNMNK